VSEPPFRSPRGTDLDRSRGLLSALASFGGDSGAMWWLQAAVLDPGALVPPGKFWGFLRG
jgi:hypothetical protein